MTESDTNNPSKIIAVFSGTFKLPLEPENISTIPLYHIHRNLWGNLLSDSDSEGEALAAITSISEDRLLYTITLKPQAKFSNGRLITAKDATASIKRLIAIQKAGHFNAREVIKGIKPLSENEIQIELSSPTPAFSYLLSIPELGIVPEEMLSKDNKVISSSITSGAYFLSEASETKLVFKKNTHYISVSDLAPDVVEVHSLRKDDTGVKQAIEFEADFIEAYSPADTQALQKLTQIKDFKQITTRPSLSTYLVVNTESLSLKERIAVADVLSGDLDYQYNPSFEKPSYELLPPKTFGSLNLGTSLNANRSESTDLPKVVVLHASKSDLSKAIKTKLEKAGVNVEIVPHDSQDKWDLMLVAQGMSEEYPELACYLVMLGPNAMIAMTPEDKKSLTEALHANSEEQRLKSIQKVGRNILEDARIIPLLVRSYTHLYRADKIELPPGPNYDGDIKFYRMNVLK